MFGYPNEDRRNRLFLRVNDSKWSQPLSFEPVAADMQIVMHSATGRSDNYVGLSYTEGLGKVRLVGFRYHLADALQYKLTKVITIAPRFMIKNMFSYPIKVRQIKTQQVIDIAPGERAPIHELENGAPPQLVMSSDGPNLEW